MNNLVLVDSDVLIDYSRAIPTAINLLRRLEASGQVAVSDISRLELLIGARNKEELGAIDLVLGRFVHLALSEDISARAVGLIRQYRLSHGLLLADALIAATVLSLDIPLATKNYRDFQFIAGLRLTTYEG